MYLSVIIPAKNEERNIENTVRSVFDYLYGRHIEHEIIVVANRSTDGTTNIVKSLAKHIPSLQLLDFPEMGGKGFAVREGMLKAQGDLRLFMDADNSTTIDHIEKMLPHIDQGHDVAIGSIRTAGYQVAEGSEPFYRIFLGNLSNLYTRIFILPGIADTQRGFKMVTAKAAQDIFTRSVIDGWGFDIEMLALARKYGYKIKEVPIRWKNDPNTSSHPRLAAYFQVFRDSLRIKWWLISGQYSREPAVPVAAQSTK